MIVPLRFHLFVLSILTAVPAFCAPGSAEILEKLPGKSGLVVTVGVRDAGLALELAKGGDVLIQGLVTDRATRDAMRTAIRQAGQYGVASVELVAGGARLPHVENLINVLVLDSAGSEGLVLSKEEALRVVAPGGTVFIGKGGTWQTIVKPMDEAQDTWTHQNGGAANNPVSDDKELAPLNRIRYLDGIGQGGQRMGGTAGIPVVGGGVIVSDDPCGYVLENGGKQSQSRRLVARDAHSGIVKWSLPVEKVRCFLAIDGNYLVSAYPISGKEGVAQIHDLMTGEILHSIVTEEKKFSAWEVHGVVRDGVAYLAAANELLACDLATGKTLWSLKAEGFESFFSPSVTPDGKRLVVVESGTRRTGINARWPWASVHSLIALDPATGKELWRNDGLRDEVTLHVPVTDRFGFVAAPWGIGSHYEQIPRDKRDKLPRNYGVFDVTTGKMIWKKDIREGGTGDLWTQVALFHGDEVFLCQSDQFLAWDAATGQLTRQVRTPVVNQRCIRTRANGKYLITGFGTFYDLVSGKMTDQNITRAACAIGSTPGYGTIYSGPNGCRCFAQVRGFGAFTSTPNPVTVLPDHLRLETLNLPAGSGGVVEKATEVEMVTIKGGDTFRIVKASEQSIRDSWSNNEDLPFPETEPVKAGELELVAVVNQHRLEARRGGQVVWSLTTDARISSPPLVHENRVFTPAHDGYVYACELATGKLLWRALIAPDHREMVAFGQIESVWPVRNLALFEGAICAAAGRHPELDGGIHLAGLDPATGQAKWREVVAFDSAGTWFKADERREDKHLNWITNGGLEVKDGKLQIKGLDEVHGGGNKMPRMEPYPITPGK